LKKRKVEIVVISDVHLGTFGSHAVELNKYLSSIKPKVSGPVSSIYGSSENHISLKLI
jgi:hypothetical protein